VLASDPWARRLLYSTARTSRAASQDALGALAPTGSKEAGNAQSSASATSRGRRAAGRRRHRRRPFALAHALDAFSAAARGRQSDAVVDRVRRRPGYAMPAAAWAREVGRPVLFVPAQRHPGRDARRADRPPQAADLRARAARDDLRDVVTALGKLGHVTRIGSGDPVRSSIDFARFTDGRFGWGVVDPGHGLVFAASDRPARRGAAAPLSASGHVRPLILRLATPTPRPARRRLPARHPAGYRKDPVRGVYNHGWIVGDDSAISVAVQSQIDQLLEITRVAVQDRARGH
jgi:hypothetical protein